MKSSGFNAEGNHCSRGNGRDFSARKKKKMWPDRWGPHVSKGEGEDRVSVWDLSWAVGCFWLWDGRSPQAFSYYFLFSYFLFLFSKSFHRIFKIVPIQFKPIPKIFKFSIQHLKL
jgi:hypothetical protein